MERRTFGKWLATVGLAGVATASARSATAGHDTPVSASSGDMHLLVDGRRFTIGMLVYPGMFLQDLVGPLTVFEALMQREIHLLWKTKDTVGQGSTALIPVTPTTTFATCPEELDVLFVPGGVPGTFALMEDEEVLAFLRDKGASARFVTSVCTGSLILGAAGLLQGYKATSYWAMRDILAELGAIPTKGRVVIDRNRITGGGVTAGIDFGLAIAAQLTSPAYAQAIQLYLEYDPQPPFNAGSPENAPRSVTKFLNEMFADSLQTAKTTAHRAKRKLAG